MGLYSDALLMAWLLRGLAQDTCAFRATLLRPSPCFLLSTLFPFPTAHLQGV
ncbi:hypothetical protein KSP39_PZI011017 [Platanthera zijinensis]|uniref:Uncharacterized protein n=1 Tax=Platanthera zijinensis TaxID=2320716 RepID=A0AAP0BGZ1_9ASPA